MRKKDKREIKKVMAAMMGGLSAEQGQKAMEQLTPYMLSTLLLGYFFGCGHSMSRAGKKTEQVFDDLYDELKDLGSDTTGGA